MENNENPYAAPTFDSVPAKQPAGEIYRAHLATLWQRFAGNFIDSILLVAAVFPLAIAFYFVISLVIPDYPVDESESPAIWIVDTVAALVVMAICFLAINGYLLHTRGQTIGKLVMKTRIVSDQGQLVPLPRLFLKRYLLLWCIVMIPGIGSLFSLVDTLFIFRDNRKCLHDEFAATKVVTTRQPVRQRELPDKIEIPDF